MIAIAPSLRLIRRDASLHPIQWSRGAIFQAALVKSRQARTRSGERRLRTK
jgi:hypothetical protein